MFWWFRKKLHVSWFIMIICFGFSFGVWSALYYSINITFIFSILCLIILLISCFISRISLIPVAICASMIVGNVYGGLTQSSVKLLGNFIGHQVEVEGSIDGDVKFGLYGNMSMTLTNLKVDSRIYKGSIWISTKSDETIERGDSVKISGLLSSGFGNYAGAIYSAQLMQIIKPNNPSIGNVMRDWFSDNVSKVVNQPGLSLGLGFLLGEQRTISADMISMLQIVGLTHAVVASGYNLTILVRFCRRIFIKVSKYFSLFMSFVLIVIFILITGFGPSMVRASIVTTLCLLAWYYGRKFHPFVLISLAMAATLLIDPSYIWGDIGWQLSFLSFIGVMILAPLFSRYFFGEDKLNFIAQILIETISAQLVTLPIIISAFGQISNISLVANLLVVPFIPIAMLLTFIAGMTSVFLPFFASIISLPANWILGYINSIIVNLSQVSWAVTKIKSSIIFVAIFYSLIIGLIIFLKIRTKYKFIESNLVE